MYRLRSTTKTFILHPGTWVVGRQPTSGIFINAPSLSREHAIIRITTEAITVEDLKSRNGTSVNGQPIEEPVAVQSGDTIRFGQIAFLLERVALGGDSGLYTPVNPVPGRLPLRRRGPDTGLMPIGENQAASAAPKAEESPPKTTVLLAVRDRSWVDGLIRAACGHAHLDVKVVSPKEAADHVVAAAPGCLLLDVKTTGRRAATKILRAWWGEDGNGGPVIVVHSMPKHKGVVLARELGAQAYVPMGKNPAVVVSQILYQVQRASRAPSDGSDS